MTSNERAEYAAKYHQRRQEEDITYRKRRRAASLKWKRERKRAAQELIRAAKDVPCADCGKQYPPYCMDLDHVRGEKKFTVSKAVGLGRSLAEIEEEIAKCDIRCAICHRIRHHQEAA